MAAILFRERGVNNMTNNKTPYARPLKITQPNQIQLDNKSFSEQNIE